MAGEFGIVDVDSLHGVRVFWIPAVVGLKWGAR